MLNFMYLMIYWCFMGYFSIFVFDILNKVLNWFMNVINLYCMVSCVVLVVELWLLDVLYI